VITSASVLAVKKQANTIIPIVFSIGEDPVKLGLVASLNQPGGNVTGAYQFTTGLEAKRLGLLHEMVPKATTITVLINPNFSAAKTQLRDVQEAAAYLGVQLVVLRANTEKDFDAISRHSFSRERALSWSADSRFSTAGASSSSFSRHATRCTRSMNGATS
jgi:ABC-type uncharacterized transport system substrate-binding protein